MRSELNLFGCEFEFLSGGGDNGEGAVRISFEVEWFAVDKRCGDDFIIEFGRHKYLSGKEEKRDCFTSFAMTDKCPLTPTLSPGLIRWRG